MGNLYTSTINPKRVYLYHSASESDIAVFHALPQKKNIILPFTIIILKVFQEAESEGSIRHWHSLH